MSNGIFFVVGARRTGTTLLQSVLCSDPTVNPLVGEVQLLTRWVETFRFARRNFALFGADYFDDETALRDFHSRLVHRFLDHCRRRFAPATTLVLKNPELCLVIEDLIDLLPEARFVVSVRDPRDQLASELEVARRRIEMGAAGGEGGMPDVATLIELTRSYLDPMARAADRLGSGRGLFVRYEDLVLAPEEAVERLRAFTGLALADFDPASKWARVGLDWEAYRGVPALTPLYGGPIDRSRVGRFRRELSATEVGLAESSMGAQLERFGYRRVSS